MVHPAPARPWPVVSPRVRELFRRGAEVALTPAPQWLEELHAAALGGERVQAIASDPVLAEGARRANLANLLHWAAANVQHPAERVPANESREVLDTARDLVRRGLDERALDSYRTAQTVAWRRWMEICFALTDDPADLRAVLDVASVSIAAFLDDTISAVSARMEVERAELTQGTQAERRTTVALLLEGAPISRPRAEAQLGYALGGAHTAAVLWGRAGTAPEVLEAAAEVVVRESGATRRLTVVAGASTLWVWLPVAQAPAAARVARALVGHPDVRVALGRPGEGPDGFRRSHLDASTAQQMLARLGSPQPVASYADVHLVALLTRDLAASDEFVQDTLGGLLHADRETQETVRTWVQEQCRTTRTAERLYAHRNTVLRRLARADELLPRPLAEDLLPVALALEVLRWRGSPA